ncbi:MAG: hypothetical protein J6O50_17235 [Ruminiclostridium sp.]|nr:hypothetical protein [Ruminiclostridium sp.]
MLSVILGIVIMIYPRDAVFTVWQLAGIALIIEAVIDFFAVIHIAKLTNKEE